MRAGRVGGQQDPVVDRTVLDRHLVKICGLREPAHARTAATAGADLLGFIFAPARRQVSPKQARGCIDAARAAAAPRRVLAVGVFVDAPPSQMNAIADEADLDILQLHGEEPPALLAELSRPVVKALRPPAGTPALDVVGLIDRYKGVPNAPLAYLLDGYSQRAAGGEGVRAEWGLAADLATVAPLVLAGGLDPVNVSTAIAAARPLAVDVSSGVETHGAKDETKIGAFLAAAKAAFAGLA